MPRLDNNHLGILNYFDLDREYDEDDPGATPAIDVCAICAEIFSEDLCQVEHPPYEDNEYICRKCGAELTDDDN